jgi:hypothetical protein
MTIESAVKFRLVARIACLVLIAGLLACGTAMAQLPIPFTPGNPPPVLAGSVLPFNHGATGQWSQLYSQKIAPNGNVVFLDSAISELFQLAPGASTPTLIVAGASGSNASNCSDLEASGTYWNAAIAFDAQNNLYVTDRYGSSVQFCRVPYNASSGTWNFSSADIWKGPTFLSGTVPTAISPEDMAIGDDGTFYASTSGGSGPASIYKFTVDSSGNVTSTTAMVTALQEYAYGIAVDHAGNLFFIENIYGSTPGTRVGGIREIPKSATLPVSTSSGGEAQGTLLLGNSNAFGGIAGIQFDAQGNLIFGSINNSNYGGNVSGLFLVPNEGTPTNPNLVWADTVMISPISGSHQPLVDPRGFLWVATGGSSNWSPTGTLAPNCDTLTTQTIEATCLASTLVIWEPGMANLGSAATGGAKAVPITAYSVPAAGGSVTLTAGNSFTENQVVQITAGTNDALAALNGLSFRVIAAGLSSTQFEVSTSLISGGASGSTSAKATPLPYGTVYYTFNAPTTPSKIAFAQATGNSFVNMAANPTPDTSIIPPVPPCTAGATYPAFSPTETSNAQYSWCSAFVQLNAQSAGAVENELQLLNSSNGVITGSNVFIGGIGQGSAVSVVGSNAQQSIASGLNHPQQVASDPWGNTYVADSALKAIEKYPAGTTSPVSGAAIGSGLSGPTGVAVDGIGNLFIGDTGNVYEIPYVNGSLATAQQTKIASGLGTGNLSLATDTFGDVFIADQAKKQVVEITNPQAALLRQSLPLQTLGSGFTGPTAIATDNSGNVWVADGNNLWEITMPFGGATEVTSKLQGPVTGLAVDPSGSIFVAEASGLEWIPYQTTSTSSGLNINGLVTVATGLGTSGTTLPNSVALDGSENVYADYGSGSSAGLSQLSTSGAVNFNSFGEVNPNVPLEADAQLFNLGNTPLTLAALSGDAVTGASASDFTVAPATLNTPACGPSTNTQPGSSCYLGLNILAPSPGQANASVSVLSNAANASTGVNIALSANVIQDLRWATNLTTVISADTTDSGCYGSVYPGCESITVTVTSAPGAGTPQGSVILLVPGSGASQSNQTATLNGSGVATFKLTGLLGGSYNVEAIYGGFGTAGATQNTCSTPTCFAGNAAKSTITIKPATPAFIVGPPGTEGCLNWTATNCTPNSNYVTSYLSNTFVSQASNTWMTASVTSKVGTPTGSVSFLLNGKPVDSTQAQSSLNSSGIANFTLVNLTQGLYTLTAVYNGDQNFATQSITLASFEVIVPSIQVTSSPATLSTKAGTPASATLTLEPLVGFSKDVSLQCVTSSLPKYSECTFAYPNSGQGVVTVGSNTPSTIVVTISTNVPVNGGGMASLERHAPWALAGMFGLGLLGLIAGRKRFSSYMALICLALMLAGVSMGIAACTNAGYSTPPPPPVSPTPLGTYNVQIITYDPQTTKQNSLSTPLFTLPFTVQ